MKFELFNEITNKYGYWSSWAIWANVLDTPKSNIGNLSIFDDRNNITILKPNIILVGLNISRGAIKEPLANFHDKRSEATDFKIRYYLFLNHFLILLKNHIHNYLNLVIVKILFYLRHYLFVLNKFVEKFCYSFLLIIGF